MAAYYTIIRSNGTQLTQIQDGTINTTSTSLGLPGRNYPGYGQTLDTNFVRLTENFAANTPPINPLKGQLWYNTATNTLNLCPADGTTNSASWAVLATTSSGGSATLGNITVTGNIISNNITVNNSITTDSILATSAILSDNLTASTAEIDVATLGTTLTTIITTGGATTTGSFTGTWTVAGNTAANVFNVTGGNIGFSAGYGVKSDTYMYANGAPFNPSGTYNNTNVCAYMSGFYPNGSPYGSTTFTGNIAPTKVTTSTLAGGGNISGIWTLDAGARIEATYADLAERYEADAEYDVGTVVELGGEKEITEATDLSENVFGVVSNSYAYLLNSKAGTDETHPPIAISGRVKVKVIGKVNKGDRLVAAQNGRARSAKPGELTPFNSIGRALENKDTADEGTVKAIVIIK